MSKPNLFLRCGNAVLDLNDQSTYYLSQDFVPPATAYVPQITDGTSANRMNGGSLVSKRATNRQFSFTVALKGSSAAQIDMASRNVRWFLAQAGDRTQPLYLEYNPHTVTEPLWGQFGANLRYEIIFGDAVLSDGYMVGTRRTEDVNMTITLTLKPFAIGKQQRLCSVVGGIVEDTIGTVDGLSRGLIVPEGTTNKFTNPVFGNSTWNTGWTAGANLTATQNTDKHWLIPGTVNSAFLVSISAAFNELFTQSLNVGNTNKHSLSCLARARDGSAISSTQVQLYYGTTLTTIFTALGNGWYLLEAENIDGINAATDTGVILKAKQSIYVTGFQIEEKAYCTPIGFGDMLGWAWTSTAHASTSTRTAASCKISVTDSLLINAWSVHIIVRFDVANTFPNDMYLFDARDGSNLNAPFLAFSTGSDQIVLVTAGAVVCSSPALTFSAGTSYVIHATGGPSGSALYINGVSVDTDTYVAATFGANLFIGSSYASLLNLNGCIREFATCDRALTAAEVLADYTELAPLLSNNQRVGSIPWLWTKDGDNVVDNCDDSTRDNWALCGGIGGSNDAMIEIRVSGLNTTTGGYFFAVSKCRYEHFMLPTDAKVYADQSGVVDANSSGGAYSAGYDLSGSDAYIAGPAYSVYQEWVNSVHCFVRLLKSAGAGTSVNVHPALSFGYETIIGDAQPITVDSTMRLYYVGQMEVGQFKNSLFGYVAERVYPKILGRQAAVTLNVDFSMWIPNANVVYVPTSVTSTNNLLLIDGKVYEIASDYLYGERVAYGDRLSLAPHQMNFVFVISAAKGGAHTITHTATLSIKYTPHFELL